MNGNVHQLKPMTDFASRIRSAFERTKRGREEWIEGSLDLAAALADARNAHESDNAFGHWLVDNGLDDIGHQDRAALISMASDLALMRRILEETDRTSWRLIWQDSRSRFTSAGKPTPSPAEPAEHIESAATPDESEKAVGPNTSSPRPTGSRHPFFGKRDRADEVAAIFRAARTRKVILDLVNKKKGGLAWQCLLDGIDAGFITQTDYSAKVATLRLWFTNAPERMSFFARRLLGPSDIETLVTRTMPAALAHRDEVLADVGRLPEIAEQHWRAAAEAARRNEKEQKTIAAIKSMPTSEQEIVMFGHRIWPRLSEQYGEYDYDQVRTAVWFFNDLHRWLSSDQTPQSRAINMRRVITFPCQYIVRALSLEERSKISAVWRLFEVITKLYEAAPEANCSSPPTPKIEHQW